MTDDDKNDIQASIRADRDAQFERSKAAWNWLQAAMPTECDDALRKMVEVTPSMNGAAWWDCLDLLYDSDSHLDIIEPMADVMEEWTILHSYITLTLIYASKQFSVDYTNDMRVNAVRATILNNRFIEVES